MQSRHLATAVGVCALALNFVTAPAQTTRPADATTTPAATRPTSAPSEAPPLDLPAMLSPTFDQIAIVRQRYTADRQTLTQFYDVATSPTRHNRLRKFDSDWLAALASLDPQSLTPEARDKARDLRELVHTNLRNLAAEEKRDARIAPLLPMAPAVAELCEAWRRLDRVDGERAAGLLDKAAKGIDAARAALPGMASGSDISAANEIVRGLRANMRAWFNFYDGYDPLFSWWVPGPYKKFDFAMEAYAASLRKASSATRPADSAPATQSDEDDAPATAPSSAPTTAAGNSDVPDLSALLKFPHSEMQGVLNRLGNGRRGQRSKETDQRWIDGLKQIDFDKLSHDAQIDYLLLSNSLQTDLKRQKLPRPTTRPADPSGIRGRPIGDDGLRVELDGEMIPYTPDELIDIANSEFAWCDAEIRKASREMGFGDDWKKALEKVKTEHAAPGRQPEVVRDLIHESIDFTRAHDFITVPDLEAETLRATMLSPEQQLTAPFFLGGAFIQIAFPTDAMSYEARMESMRGNNLAFSHATVGHEMIPGHNMQSFMTARYRSYRNLFPTPFWTEGWSLYWEMRFYDAGFAKTPEQRIGFLFWRMHRCARIIFSLRFHQGQWTPTQCIDFLVDRVGHERDNAAAEVRRSFGGGYGPLYQAGYMLGALQLRGLQKEIVGGGKLTDRQFHDAVLQQNAMPIAMLRAALSDQKLTRDGPAPWRFYEKPAAN